MSEKEIDTGGPAFPTPEVRDANGNGVVEAGCGLHIRDYFAAAALQGMWAGRFTMAKSTEEDQPPRKASYEDMADWAYLMADAMIAARRM